MAFVFRAEKKDIPADKAQQPGPGHYDFPQKNEIAENRIAFHSSKEREFLGAKADEYPGPGSYNVTKDILSHEGDQHVFFIPANPGSETIDYKATSVFKSKAKRFGTQKVEENPGPGTYNLGKGFIKKGTTAKLNDQKNHLNLVHDIIQKGNKIAPSIPSNVHSYGYTENEEHKLLLNKNPLLQVQQFVGPGYYESKANTQGAKYRGPTFHKTTAKKGTNFENSSATSNLIGPGTYSLDDVNGPSYKSNPQSGFVSNTTRTFDNNVKKKLGLGKFPNRTPLSSQSVGRSNISGMETDDDEYDDEYIKDATPGPGYYHNESMLSSFVSKTPNSRLSLSTADKLRNFPRTVKAQAFGSSPRFKDPNPNGHDVGPGEYDVTSKPKNNGLKYIKVPFQSSNTRFERGNYSSNPGPGNYDPPVNLVDQVKKKGATGYAGSFGVTENRFKISKLLEETPGPGTYIGKKKDKDDKLNPPKQSHYFQSDSKRGVFVGKIDYQAHPGSYELDYYNIAKKKDKDEEDDGLDQPKRYPFNTGQARFDKPKEKPIPENDDEDDDDDDEPTFKNSRNLESLLKSKMKQKPSATFLSTTKRNIGGIKNDSLPGPGTYFEQAQNGWNKRTFNIHFTGE